MILVVSHFTKNKGTTDYYLDYLAKKKVPHYYLRHPFFHGPEAESALLYFDGQAYRTVREWRKSRHEVTDMIHNFLVSCQVSWRLKGKVDQVFGFGGFNVAPFLLTHPLFPRRRVFFWGCDYSRQRFTSKLLNTIYLGFETFSCKYATMVIQPTIRQEEARIRYHALTKKRSIIAPNGINYHPFKRLTAPKGKAIFYLGSITSQHGIVGFIQRYYIEKQAKYKLYVIGGGEKEAELKALLAANPDSKVMFLGQKSQDQIRETVESLPEELFGIAPYDAEANDHVYYGDSLKIKEYLNYGIPFITSKVAYVQDNLKPFGIVYEQTSELDQIMMDLDSVKPQTAGVGAVLATYEWSEIFDTLTAEIYA